MALVDSQDISLIINAQTTGMAGVNTLVDQINALGRSGAATGPEINRISEEIVRLGQQQVRINGLEQAIDSSKQTWKAVSEARKEVEVLDKALSDARGADASAQAIRLLEKELRAANKELTGAEKAWDNQKKALTAARAEAAGMGIDTKNVGEAQRKLAADVAAANQRVQDASRNTGAALRNAFEVVGVRSAKAIETEILDVERALQRIAAEGKVTGREFDRVWAAGQERIKALKDELNGTGQAMDQVGSKTNSVIDGVKKLAAAYGGMQAARAFLEANVELESLRRGLTAVTGSAESAEAELDRLRASSNRLGVELGPLAQAYTSLSAATKGSAIEGQATRDVFDAITSAMGALGAGSARTEQALTAVSQMASKGVISMEELRIQLAEALPSAMDAAARGLGITKQEMTDLVSSGSLLAEDFLPALAKGLRETFGDGEAQVGGFAASWQRLKNTFSETAQALGDLGFMSALAGGAEMLSTAVKEVAASFVLVGKQIGVTAGAIATFDLSSPIESIKRWWGAMGEAEQEVRASLEKTSTAATTASTEITAAAQSGTAAAADFAEAATDIDAAAVALDHAATAAATATPATAAAGEAIAVTGESFSVGGEAVEFAAVALDHVTAAAQTAGPAASDAAMAAVTAGQSFTDAAPSIETAALALDHVAAAAESAVPAADAAAQAATVAAVTAQEASGGWVALSVAYAAALKEAETTTAQSTKLAEAIKAEGQASILNAQLTKDETVVLQARVVAVENNATATARIAEARAAELAVLQQQVAALKSEAEQTGSLTAAKANQLEKLQRLVESKTIEVQRSREVALAMQAEAQAAKDAVVATESVEAAYRRLGITSVATLKAMADSARVDFERIRNSGQATTADLQRAFAAYAERAIAANNGVVDNNLRAEAAMYGLSIQTNATGRAIVTAMNAAAAATNAVSDSADGAADSYRRLAREADRARDRIDRLNGGNGNGDGDGDGGGTGGGNTGPKRTDSAVLGILERAKDLGGWAYYEQIMNEYKNAFRGSIYGTYGGGKIYAEFWNRIEKEIREAEDKKRFGDDGSPMTQQASGGAGTTHKIQIQFGNKTENINTASARDAENLIGVLQQLESAAARS